MRSVVAALMIASTAACGGQAQHDPRPGAIAESPAGARAATPTPAASSSSSGPVAVIDVSRARAASRTDLEFKKSWPAARPKVDGKGQQFLGSTQLADGTILGSTVNTSDWKMGDPSTIASLDPRSGRYTTLVTNNERTPGTLLGSVSANNTYIVWVDSASADLYSDDWTLRSKNRHTGEVKTLAEAPPSAQGSPTLFDGGSYPELYKGWVFVVGDSGDTEPDGKPISTIYRIPVDGSAGLTKYIHDAERPRVKGNTLYYHRGSTAQARDLTSGADRRIASTVINRSTKEWNFAKGTFASVGASSRGKYAVKIQTPSDRLITVRGFKKKPMLLHVTSRWVSFIVSPDTEHPPRHYVVDLRRKRLLIVKPRVSYSAADGAGASFFYMSRADETKRTWDRIITYTLRR